MEEYKNYYPAVQYQVSFRTSAVGIYPAESNVDDVSYYNDQIRIVYLVCLYCR